MEVAREKLVCRFAVCDDERVVLVNCVEDERVVLVNCVEDERVVLVNCVEDEGFVLVNCVEEIWEDGIKGHPEEQLQLPPERVYSLSRESPLQMECEKFEYILSHSLLQLKD